MQVSQNKKCFFYFFVIEQRTDIVKGAVLCQFLPLSTADADGLEEGTTSSETRKRSRSSEPES